MKLKHLIQIICVLLFSCSTETENQQQEAQNNLDTDITIYNNIVTLDASNLEGSEESGARFIWQLVEAPNDFECYQSDC